VLRAETPMKLSGEKQAWLHVVRPSELDTHMAAVGQAEANARLIKHLFSRIWMRPGDRLLVHGCGTCQMFDYIEPIDLGTERVTLADLSADMLEASRERLSRLHGISYETVADDIEQSRISGPYACILLSMVLLHVHWRSAVANMLNLDPRWVAVIEQSQRAGTPIVSADREVPSSIRKFAEMAEPQLIDRRELIGEFARRGYRLAEECETAVPDQKRMIGLLFDNHMT
jgi:SAM-dependent methyltransferase